MTRRFSLPLLTGFAALPVWLLLGQSAPPRPYVVLVSLDGFRYDYAEKYHVHRWLIRPALESAIDIAPGLPHS